MRFIKETFSFQFLFQHFIFQIQLTDTERSHSRDDQLDLTACLINRKISLNKYFIPVLRHETDTPVAGGEHDAFDLRIRILQGKIPVA